MRGHAVRAVAGVELRRLARSRDYWIPLGLLALLFFVLIPLVSLSVMARAESSNLARQVGGVVDALPERVQENIEGNTPGARAAYAFAVYLLAPVAIVVPLTVASAVGAASLVGERERGTGELLAHAPLTEGEIYAGKLLAALAPGYAATIAGFTAYSLLVNLVVGPAIGHWFFPTAGWLVLILWVVPPFIALALAVIVALSGRVRSTAAAQQAASLVSVPVILAAYMVSGGLLYDPTVTAFFVGVGAWLVAGLALWRGARSLRREALLGVAAMR